MTLTRQGQPHGGQQARVGPSNMSIFTNGCEAFATALAMTAAPGKTCMYGVDNASHHQAAFYYFFTVLALY